MGCHQTYLGPSPKPAFNYMENESKKLIYKLVEGVNGQTLQTLLKNALQHFPLPANRIETLGTDGSHIRFVNVHREHHKITIGIFHRVTKGAGQYVIEMADSRKDWPVELVTAKSDEKKNREFVEGTLFFAVWKNHIVLHQSVACRFEQFEGYCSWLLSLPVPGSADDTESNVCLIGFADPLPPDLRKKAKQPVKSVKFGGSITTGVAKTPSSTKKAQVYFTPTGGMWEGIMAILDELNADVPKEMLLDNALGERDIRVALELSCTKKKSETTAGEVLSVLGRSLSHSDADAVEVSLADGTKIRSKDMKVETTIRVECVQKQPVPEPLFKRMVEWMQELIENKTIIDDEPFGNTK